MNEETFIRLVNTQTQALTQIAMISASTKEVLEKVVTNQALQAELLTKQAAAQEEFRTRSFNTLLGIVVFLTMVIAGLMYRLNIKGADAITDAVKVMSKSGRD